MPFVNGKFYINPTIGRVLERNKKRAVIVNFAQGRLRQGSPQADSGAHWVTIDGRHILIESVSAKTQGAEATRKSIAATATKYSGSTAWAFAKKKDNFPANTNKCNKFVYDVTGEAGAPAIVIGSDGKPRPPLAAEWADPTVRIPDWQALDPNEKPRPGDVAAYKLAGGGISYSGHSGVVTAVDQNGEVHAIAAHADLVGPDEKFNPGRGAAVIAYRRFSGGRQ